MTLSCSCESDWTPEPGDWEISWDQSTADFERLATSRRKRCSSCNELINLGDFAIEFTRYRHPYNEIEARINGVDWECFEEPGISIAPIFLCEKCGEIFLNLHEVGFECVFPTDDMNELLRDYQIEYAPPKMEKI